MKMPVAWIFLLNLTHLFLIYLSKQLFSVNLLDEANVISIITVMLISLTAYLVTTSSYTEKKNKVSLTGVMLGAKFLIYLAYMLLMIIFFEIPNKKIFVFTFMLIYVTGTFQLCYLLLKKLRA